MSSSRRQQFYKRQESQAFANSSLFILRSQQLSGVNFDFIFLHRKKFSQMYRNNTREFWKFLSVHYVMKKMKCKLKILQRVYSDLSIILIRSEDTKGTQRKLRNSDNLYEY